MNPFSYRVYFSQNPELQFRPAVKPAVAANQSPNLEYLFYQINRISVYCQRYSSEYDAILRQIYASLRVQQEYFERLDARLSRIGAHVLYLEDRIKALEDGYKIVYIM